MNKKKSSNFIVFSTKDWKTRNMALSIFSLILFPLSSCIGQTTESHDVPSFVDVATYEPAFVDYYVNEYKAADSDDKTTTVYLFGFKEGKVDEWSLNDWRRRAREGFKNLSPFNYISKDTSIFRHYIALKKADLEYAGKRYTANSKGIVKIGNPVDPSKIRTLNIKTLFGHAVPCDLKIASTFQRGNKKIVIYALGDNWISDM